MVYQWPELGIIPDLGSLTENEAINLYLTLVKRIA